MAEKTAPTKKPVKTGKKQAVARDEHGRFPKGQSGNPNGRPPKGHSITETIQAMMDEKPEIKKALGSKILEYALKGDMTAIKLLWQYMDGMPTQRNELTGKDGEDIKSTLIYLPANGRDQDT